MNKKSLNLFTYITAFGSMSFDCNNGCKDRSSRRQTDLAICKLDAVFPPFKNNNSKNWINLKNYKFFKNS